jgi:hypothetical protein
MVGLSVGLFILLEYVGGNLIHIDGVKMMANGLCYRYLGCNNGFFGYDAVVHFSSGIMDAALILWLMHKFGRLDVFRHDEKNVYIKNITILIGLLLIIGFGWEMIELMYDGFRVNILHMQLLVPNRLAQPTDADTMGDIFFGVCGGVLGGFLSRLFGSRVFEK